MAEPVLGKEVLLQFYKDGDYQDYLCATDVSIEFSAETKSVRTINSGMWADPRHQRKSYVISLSGIERLDNGSGVNSFDLLDYFLLSTAIIFRMIWEDDSSNMKVCYGTALPDKCNFSGGSEGFSNSTFTMQGSGEPTISDTLILCSLVVTNFSADLVAPGEGGINSYDMTVVYSGVGSLLRFEYSIDGGGRLVAYDNPFNFTSTSGDHTVEIWPICTNGQEGTSFSQVLTLT